MEPRYNEGLKDWQNLLAITRCRYIEVLFYTFRNYRGKENRSLYRGLRYIEVRDMVVPLQMRICTSLRTTNQKISPP